MKKLLSIMFCIGLSIFSISTIAADVIKPAKPIKPTAPKLIEQPKAGVIMPNNNIGNRPQTADDWVNPNDRVDKRMYPEDRTEEQATEEMNRRLIKEKESLN